MAGTEALNRPASRVPERQLSPDRFTRFSRERASSAEFKEITVGHKQPGLDGRHRDKDGEIHRKRSDTLIKNIRREYPGFAPDVRGDMKLGNYLDREGCDSLTDALKKQQ